MKKDIKRGNIYWINLDPAIGSEIKKKRPCLVVSNNIANKYFNQVTVIPLTSKRTDQIEPFQVFISTETTSIKKDSKALTEQIRTVSKKRVVRFIGDVDNPTMDQVERALKIHLGLR